MPRLVHDDPDLVYACPCCDKAGRVNERTGRNVHKDPDRPFRCGDCGSTFRIVVQRESYDRNRDGTFESRHSKGVWDSHRKRILAKHGMLSGEAAD